MGEIIKGKPVADALSEQLIREVNTLSKKGIIPKLTIVRVGARPDDLSYEKGALARGSKVGIATQVRELKNEVQLDEFIRVIRELNEDKSVHGILILRPLPKHLDEKIIQHIISAEKDVDGFNPLNMGRIVSGDPSGFAPCTPSAVMEILKHYKVPVKGSNAVVVGVSMVIGKPMVEMFINERATVTAVHRSTKNPDAITSSADILVVAAGVSKLMKGSGIKDGAVIIDVGIHVDLAGRLTGDVDFDEAVDKASMITPVPGGVGAVTTTVLAQHVVRACKQQNRLV